MKTASHVHAEIAMDLRNRWPYCVDLLQGGQLAPAADYLDAEGIDYIRANYKRPTAKHYAKHCPRVYRVALAIFDAISEDVPNPYDVTSPFHRGPAVWAKNQLPNKKKGMKIWHTYTAGTKRAGNNKTWYDDRLAVIDIIHALVSPDRYALGAKSSHAGQPIHQLRIDVDMDSAWGHYGDIDDIRSELALEHALLTDMGYHPHYFRTGNRGHQIVIPVAATRNRDRARQALDVIVKHLTAAPRQWQAKIDCNSLDSIMRLPLGRHALTSQVAWMIDPATAEHLPLDQQVEAVEAAFTCWSNDSLDLVFESDSVHCYIKAPIQDAAASAPPNGDKDKNLYTVTVSDPGKYHVGCEWARKVMDAGFLPGEFRRWAYAKNGGSNGIGAAKLLYGLEVPHATQEKLNAHVIARLTEYVCQVPESTPGSHANRIELVERLVPLNNINPYYSDGANQHKDIDGELTDDDERYGQALARILVEAQQANRDIKPRVFTPSALRTIQHIGALVHMLFCRLDQEKNLYTVTVSVSSRTLAAAIAKRWPEDTTSHMDVARQLAYITAGASCLVEVLQIDGEREKTSDAIKYRKGIGWAVVRLSFAWKCPKSVS